MTGWSFPKTSPEATLKAKAYEILPQPPVTATVIGAFCWIY